jgi:hypothetical protein
VPEFGLVILVLRAFRTVTASLIHQEAVVNIDGTQRSGVGLHPTRTRLLTAAPFQLKGKMSRRRTQQAKDFWYVWDCVLAA